MPSSRRCQGIRAMVLAIIVVFGTGVVLFHERRLAKGGLILGVTCTITIGITRALLEIGFTKAEDIWGSSVDSERRHSFIFLSLTLGLIMSCFATFWDTPRSSWHKNPPGTHLLLLFNASSFVGAFLTGSSPLLYSPLLTENENTPNYRPVTAPCIYDALVSTVSIMIILIATAYLRPEVTITWTQVFSYLLSVVCAIELGDGSISSAGGQSYKSLEESPSFWERGYLIRGVIMLLPCYLAVSLIFVKSSVVVDLAGSGYHAVLDTAYNSESRFDIVVSMYQEDPEEVRKILEAIKGTRLLRTVVPRIILYTKDEQSNVTALQLTTGADQVISLENKGREGATFLTHITTQWDDLATQTLFIQGRTTRPARNARTNKLLPRPRDRHAKSRHHRHPMHLSRLRRRAVSPLLLGRYLQHNPHSLHQDLQP